MAPLTEGVSDHDRHEEGQREMIVGATVAKAVEWGLAPLRVLG